MTSSQPTTGTSATSPTPPPPLLLVRPPSSRLSSGQLTHLAASTSDPPTHARSLAQWEAYVDVYRRRGWEIVQLEAAEECPDGVFVEDAIVVFPSVLPGDATRPDQTSGQEGGQAAGTVVLPRSGSIARRSEHASAKRAVEEHLVPRGFAMFDFLVEDPSGEATLDGGDVLKVLDLDDGRGSGKDDDDVAGRSTPTVYIGHSSRTNEQGIELVRRLLEPQGWKVVTVAVRHHLHLSEFSWPM